MSETDLIKLVKDYFHFLDLPKHWGFAKWKNDCEKKLRKYVKDAKPVQTKQMVVRKK